MWKIYDLVVTTDKTSDLPPQLLLLKSIVIISVQWYIQKIGLRWNWPPLKSDWPPRVPTYYSKIMTGYMPIWEAGP